MTFYFYKVQHTKSLEFYMPSGALSELHSQETRDTKKKTLFTSEIFSKAFIYMLNDKR